MFKSFAQRAATSPAARSIVFGLAYFGGAELGHTFSLHSQDQSFATFWPPAGILLAALVQSPRRGWPLLLAAACAANLSSNMLVHGKSVLVALGFCVANCGEACLGAWLLGRFVGLPLTLTRVKEVLGLACLAAMVSTLFGATLGAAIAAWTFHASYWTAWQVWWIADAVGVLVVAPVAFTWSAGRGRLLKGVPTWRIVEGSVLFVGLIVVTEGVYGELLPAPLTVPIFILPFLLWAGLRFDPPGAAIILFATAVIGVWNVSQGRGPYRLLSAVPSEQLVRAQATLCILSLCVLSLAAAVAERKHAVQQKIKLISDLEQALSEIKTLRGLIPLCAWCKKIRDDHGFWRQLEEYLSGHTEAEFTHGLCPECLEKQFDGTDTVSSGKSPSRNH